MHITLMRHGQPKFSLQGWVQTKDLPFIAKKYEATGIVGGPPEKTLKTVQKNNYIVCSHLKRSVDSAHSLGFTKIDLIDPLFAETAIPHFAKGHLKLPVSIWVILLRFLWLFGFSRNGESLLNAKKRAKVAAKKLITLAETHNEVLLIGHGFINFFITKELRKLDWQGSKKPDKDFWAYNVYKKDYP